MKTCYTIGTSVLMALLLASCTGEDSGLENGTPSPSNKTVLRLAPLEGGLSNIEFGYSEDDHTTSTLGCHVYIPLEPFSVGDPDAEPAPFSNHPKLCIFRIVIPPVSDLHQLDGAALERSTNSFHVGDAKILNGNDSLPLTVDYLAFSRAGNEIFLTTIKGNLGLPPGDSGMGKAFEITCPLPMQFGYGAPDDFPSQSRVRSGLEMAGDLSLPTRMDTCRRTSGRIQEPGAIAQATEIDRPIGPRRPAMEGEYENFMLFALLEPEAVEEWRRALMPFPEGQVPELPEPSAENKPDWWMKGTPMAEAEYYQASLAGRAEGFATAWIAIDPPSHRIYFYARRAETD